MDNERSGKGGNLGDILLILFLIAVILLLCNRSVAQSKPDTVEVVIYYNDTACKYDKTDVASIYNSGCQKEIKGYIVMWMYYTEILWADKKPLPKNINYWFYKPKEK